MYCCYIQNSFSLELLQTSHLSNSFNNLYISGYKTLIKYTLITPQSGNGTVVQFTRNQGTSGLKWSLIYRNYPSYGINDSLKYSVHSQEGFYTLLVLNATFEDAGIYTCRVAHYSTDCRVIIYKLGRWIIVSSPLCYLLTCNSNKDKFRLIQNSNGRKMKGNNLSISRIFPYNGV